MMSLKMTSKSAKRKERLTSQKELKKRKRKNGPIMLNTISAVKLLPDVRNLKLLPGVKPAMTNIRKTNVNVILLLKAITFMIKMR